MKFLARTTDQAHQGMNSPTNSPFPESPSPEWAPNFAPPARPLEGPYTTDVRRLGMQGPPSKPRFGSCIHVNYSGVHYGACLVRFDYLTKKHRVIFDADEEMHFETLSWLTATFGIRQRTLLLPDR